MSKCITVKSIARLVKVVPHLRPMMILGWEVSAGFKKLRFLVGLTVFLL